MVFKMNTIILNLLDYCDLINESFEKSFEVLIYKVLYKYVIVIGINSFNFLGFSLISYGFGTSILFYSPHT